MLKIGLIGAGKIGNKHLDALMQVKNAKVVAIADANEDNAKYAASKCGAFAVQDFRELLNDVDAVFICTAPTLHKEQVVIASEAGKHIFCEKPIATSLEDGDAIIKAVSKNGVKMMVGFNMRFRAPFKKLKDLVSSGIVGDVVSSWTVRIGPTTAIGTNWRTTPGLLCGATIESVSHDIDLLRWICGDIASVYGRALSTRKDLEGYDDNSFATLKLKNGGCANLYVSWSSSIGMNTRGVVGTKGTACVEGPGWWTLSQVRWSALGSESENVISVAGSESVDMCYREEDQHFVDCINNHMPLSVNEHDGIEALRISLAIIESSTKNCVIKL